MADDSESGGLSHLHGLLTLDDADFVLGGLANDELGQLPIAVNNIQLELNVATTPGGPRYLVYLEYEKYDAMISTLFKLMDRRGHLFEWRTPGEFRDAIEQISTETRGKTTRG